MSFSNTSTSRDQWLSYGYHQIITEVGMADPRAIDDIHIENCTNEQFIQDPGYWLDYYVSLAAYFNSIAGVWNSVYDFLDTEYSTQFAKNYMEQSGSNSAREYAARAQLSGLREARVLAQNHARKWMAKYYHCHSFFKKLETSAKMFSSQRRMDYGS